MAYMFGIIVFLAMLAVCWFGFMAAERQAGRL
nr:Chain UA, PufZ [Cereibacter sphaeroides 2.4.1]7PQD_UB Chain UB, PufZ [Cereibacter sphaeroides 2.4.1]7PQD_ua Chain ua, PufZ [Cereibacter sphaeroides 2.4.1]7PQD_ub Chain ub, PufZ [Cereibacter sphaeroides 2.4.1]